MEKEITNQELLNSVNDSFSELENKMDGRFDKMDKRLTKIEATMTTKDYLDDKLGDLRGDLVVLMRKEDVKVKKLVDILKKRELISEEEVNEIMSMEPFPQLAL